MKFSTRVDTNKSAERLFDNMSDFNRLEELLIERGANVTRISAGQETGQGLIWDISFEWRGKDRAIRMEVKRIDRPERISMGGYSDSLDITVNTTIIPLSSSRARMIYELEINPRNMRARLMLQTAKLGKARLDRRFDQRIRELVGQLGGIA